ncbi:MAG: DUF1361 domain-containing protein [Armatimonadota bacterium]|nr:DUF1361 domain-containing protein [Armatimonadota bacterium]
MAHTFLTWVIWNLFLAAVPVATAQAICRTEPRWRARPVLKIGVAVLLLVWLAFLPNTCYLLTEWRHFLARLDSSDLYIRSQLDNRMTLLLMFYTAFYFCYSAMGMLAFALAIRPIACLVRKDGAAAWVWGIPLFLLTSLGVYLGLVLRFNSWDLITRPSTVWAVAASLAARPVLAAFLVLFAGMLWLAYIVTDIWIDGLILRLGRGELNVES